MTLLGLAKDLVHDGLASSGAHPPPPVLGYLIDENGVLVLDVNGNPIPIF